MAYCKKCGAYIPDGLSACLACGFDENMKAEESAAAAAQTKNDELRRKLEEQRRVQQEANRRGAEQEQARRQQQEESRRGAEEELARRQAEKQQQEQANARSTAYRSVVRDLGSTVRDMGSAVRDSSGESNKLFAALSYISFLFILPYILCPQDGFAKFHAKQGLKLFIFSVIADALGALTGFGWIFTLLRLYLIYKGMTNAFNGREEPLPYIGNIGG